MEDLSRETNVSQPIVFPSKVDTWIVAIIALPLAALPVAVWLDGGGFEQLAAFMGLILVLGAITIGSVCRIRYELFSDHLIARMGFFRQRVPLQAIREVYPTRNPLSAIAASLDRLALRFAEGPRGMILVSPRDKERFVEELAVRIPGAILIAPHTIRVSPTDANR